MLECGKLLVYFVYFFLYLGINFIGTHAFCLFGIGIYERGDNNLACFFILSADYDIFRNKLTFAEVFFKLLGEYIFAV